MATPVGLNPLGWLARWAWLPLGGLALWAAPGCSLPATHHGLANAPPRAVIADAGPVTVRSTHTAPIRTSAGHPVALRRPPARAVSQAQPAAGSEGSPAVQPLPPPGSPNPATPPDNGRRRTLRNSPSTDIRSDRLDSEWQAPRLVPPQDADPIRPAAPAMRGSSPANPGTQPGSNAGSNPSTNSTVSPESTLGPRLAAPPGTSSGPAPGARPMLPPPTTVETWRETPDGTAGDNTFVPPLDQSSPASENAPDLPLAGETPFPVQAQPQPGEDDNFWIVSSRSARQPAGAPESSLDLAYLMGAPNGLIRQPRERFLGSLRPDRPVCFVIHGSYNYWPDVLRESRRCRDWIARSAQGQPVQMVFFTWPANGYVPIAFPVELAVLGRRASYHGVYLANLLGHFPPEQPVCLVGHSHGARCVVATLHALGGGAVEDGTRLAPGLAPPQRVRSVLLAAAIDHHWLNPGARYGRALFPVEKMLIVHNQADAWLRVYSWKNLLGNSSALGQSGLSQADHFQLASFNQKVVLLDGTRLTGNDHDFAAFNTRAEYADAIAPMVTFTDVSPALPPAESVPSAPYLTNRRPVPPATGVRPVHVPEGLAPPSSNSSVPPNSRNQGPVATRGGASSRGTAEGLPPASPATVGSEMNGVPRGSAAPPLNARAQPTGRMGRGRNMRRPSIANRSGTPQPMARPAQSPAELAQGPAASQRATSGPINGPTNGPVHGQPSRSTAAAARNFPPGPSGTAGPSTGVSATGVSRATILAPRGPVAGRLPPGSLPTDAKTVGMVAQHGMAQPTVAPAGVGTPSSRPVATAEPVIEEVVPTPDTHEPRTPILPGSRSMANRSAGLVSEPALARRLSAPGESWDEAEGVPAESYSDRIPIHPASSRRSVVE